MSETVSTTADAGVPAGADDLRTGSFTDPVSPRLADFMSPGWGEQPKSPLIYLEGTA